MWNAMPASHKPAQPFAQRRKVGRPEIYPETYEAAEHLYKRVYGHLNPKMRAATGLLKFELARLEEAMRAVPRNGEELSRWAARLVAHELSNPRIRGGISGRRIANMLSDLKQMGTGSHAAWGKNPFDEALEWIRNGEADEPLE